MRGGFLAYALLRTARAALTIAGVVVLVFALVRVIPGDPVDAILGDSAPPEDRAELRRALGLDKPWLAQFAIFISHLWDGSLGYSFRQSTTSVASLIADALPHSAVLATAAMWIAIAIAVPLGSLAAVYRGRRIDRVASVTAMLGLAIPNIWLGPLLILGFSVKLQWLPMPGDTEAGVSTILLPAVTLGATMAAILTRQTRASLAEVLSEQYILAARARGVSGPIVVLKHGLRNALLPVMTIAATQFGALLSGTVVVEKVFERDGLGLLFLQAFFDRDIPVVQGCVLVIAATYVGVNLLLDLTYGLVDPRVKVDA